MSQRNYFAWPVVPCALAAALLCWAHFSSFAGELRASKAGPAAIPAGTNSPAVADLAGTNSPAVATNSTSSVDDKHVIGIGDRLSIRIVEDEGPAQSYVVADDGELDAPYVGRMPVVGMTCKEYAAVLKAALEKDYYYKATVVAAIESINKTSSKLYLVGAVRGPGPQEIPTDEVLTVSKAVMRAGGFMDFADEKHVKITRKDPVTQSNITLTVNVGDVLRKGKIELDEPVKPNDLIYVPERLIRF